MSNYWYFICGALAFVVLQRLQRRRRRKKDAVRTLRVERIPMVDGGGVDWAGPGHEPVWHEPVLKDCGSNGNDEAGISLLPSGFSVSTLPGGTTEIVGDWAGLTELARAVTEALETGDSNRFSIVDGQCFTVRLEQNWVR